MNNVVYIISFIDFIFPHGWDWKNNFVHKAIQYWEHFYINWIRHGRNILVIHPDNSFEILVDYKVKYLEN